MLANANMDLRANALDEHHRDHIEKGKGWSEFVGQILIIIAGNSCRGESMAAGLEPATLQGLQGMPVSCWAVDGRPLIYYSTSHHHIGERTQSG